MEAIIIIAVIAIIGIVIYVNSTDTKFNKAVNLQNKKRFDEAQEVFLSISKKHPLAIARYASCFFQQGEILLKQNKQTKAISFFNKVIESQGLLESNSDKQSYSEVSSKAFYEIAQIQFDNISDSTSLESIRLYKNNLEYISQSGFENSKEFKKLISLHDAKIENIYYEIANRQFNNIGRDINTKVIKEVEKNIKYISNLPYKNKRRFQDLITKHNSLIDNIYFTIAKNKFDNISNGVEIETIKQIKASLGFIKEIGYISSTSFSALIRKHYNKLAITYDKLAVKSESQKSLKEAIGYYKNAAQNYKQISEKQLYHNSIARIEICKLKEGIEGDEISEKAVLSSEKPIIVDFYYRYSISLLKQKKFSQAEEVINNNLDKRKKEVKELLQICLSEKIKFANAEIEKINEKVSHINEGNLSSKEALDFYNSIPDKATELSQIIPEVKKDIEAIRPSIFNRITQHFIENEEYVNLINLIIKYPNFHSSSPLLKNLGNACLNYLRINKLTEKNYKILISLFLTSAYSDKVILYSLEETLWDDEYTFTLSDSIGSSYELHSKLPANVNYDEVTDSNISIGESQRFLISQFEALLNEQEINGKLIHDIHEFYDSEKYAIEKIIEIIPNEIFFATPYFAKKYNLYAPILKELENDYNEYENEEALKIGELYNVKGYNNKVQEFGNAKQLADNIINSIGKVNKSSFQKSTTQSNLRLIKRYSSINETLEIRLVESLTQASKVNPESESLLEIIQSSIKISQSKDKLKFLFAHYASNLCVSKINANKMTNFEGLKIMKEAYLTLPNDSRVCSNIITLIRMNLMDVLNNNSRNSYEIYSILDSIKQNISLTFKNNASELSEAKTEILNQLPADARVAITSGINLSSQGEKLKKALDYLGSLGGVSRATDPLAALRTSLGLDLPF